MTDEMTSLDNLPVLHVLVVGFHHKKGCQVEYSYPPLMDPVGGDPHSPELPSQWKQLPSLSLPDGSHNFAADTAYFHLPALDNPRKTVFGISCYRQIDADKVVNKTADITRGSVQKSVCVLSRLPLYGQIQVKMSLITEAYFQEGDFTRLDLIHQTYDNLNACLSNDMLHTQQLYVGLSAREFVKKFRQRSLVLFKLMLLERKVLFMQSPVQDLCSFFLTLLSLHPGMLESGLDEASRIVPADTPPNLSPNRGPTKKREETPLPVEAVVPAEEASEKEADPLQDSEDPKNPEEDPEKIEGDPKKSEGDPKKSEEDLHAETEADHEDAETRERRDSIISSHSIVEQASEKVSGIKGKLTGALGYITGYKSNDALSGECSKSVTSMDPGQEDPGPIQAEEAIPVPNFQQIAGMKTEDFGLPLNVFTGGNLCHPYLSLSYLDILSQPSIHGYLIGATNILFKQKKGIAEVVVEIDKDKYEMQDQDLKRALHLTTEDLRFMDNIVKHVAESSCDVFLDGVGWEGGDEWVRAQFRYYLVCLLRTSLESASEDEDYNVGYFNSSFIQLWKQTNNYKLWKDSVAALNIREDLPAGHPFSGHLSMTDMKLHLSNTISNTEGGKKVSAVVSNTSKAVAGGLSSAKGAFSSFITSFRQPPVEQQQQTLEAAASCNTTGGSRPTESSGEVTTVEKAKEATEEEAIEKS